MIKVWKLVGGVVFVMVIYLVFIYIRIFNVIIYFVIKYFFFILVIFRVFGVYRIGWGGCLLVRRS